MAEAQRQVSTGAQLRRLLAERAGLHLLSASVSALLTRQPAQVKLETLAALCTALECTPDDLLEVDTTPVPDPRRQGHRPAQPPLHGFDQNQIWCELVVMTCELTAWMQMHALDGPGRRWEPKRRRLRLFSAAAG